MDDISLTSAPVTWQVANQIEGSHARGANGYIECVAEAVAVHQGGLVWLPSPQRVEMVDGVLADCELPINDPDVWNWRITPHLGVHWPPFHVNIEEGGTDLATAAIVPGKGPVRVVQGPQGGSVVGAEDQGDGTIRFILDDGTRTKPMPITRGPAGPANSIKIGTVLRGDEPYASLTGAAPNQVLNLVLPKGDPGQAEDLEEATPQKRGLMSAKDKTRLDATPTRAEVGDVTRQTLNTTYSVADNFLGTAPQYVTRLDVRMNNVMQAFARDSRGFYYMSQEYRPGGAKTGHFSVARTDAGGRLIDSAVLLGGGHGGPWGFEEIDGEPYLWIWWTSVNKLLRWKYTPGIEVSPTHSSVKAMPDLFSKTPGFSWANLTISQPLDLLGLMMRTSDDDGWYDVIQLRRLSEYKKGIDNVLAELPPIPGKTNGSFQGIAVTEDHAYVLRGTGGEWPQTAHMDQYRWSDGKRLGTKDLSHLAQQGIYVGGKEEVECIFPVWDDAGRVALLFGFETGRNGKNIHSIYRLAPPDFQGDVGVSASLARLYAPLRWDDLPLASGFTSTGSASRPQYARDANGMIHLRGRVARTSGNMAAGTVYTIGTFVHEYRPPAPVRVPVAGGPTTQWGRFDIDSATGEMQFVPISGDLGWFDLTSIYWTTDWGYIR